MTPPARPRVLVWGLALIAALVGPAWMDDPADARIRLTIRVALACYFLAVAMLLLSATQRSIRLVWTLGLVAYLVHVAVAFHLAFGWSHADAVSHTRERSGVGEGIYASHLFTLVWTLDVCCWWLAPESHANRRAWVGWTLHGFMAFMVFEGTVVYETGFIRWAGVVAFSVLGTLVAWRKSWG